MQSYLKTILLLVKELESKDLLQDILKMQNYPDEPQMHIYSATLKSIEKLTDGFNHAVDAGGFSFRSKEFALLKCLVETAERLCNVCYRKKDLLYSSFNNIQENALDVTLYLNDDEIKKKSFGWVKGINLYNNSSCLIPAQLVYYNYIREPEEPYLSEMISTGAAGGFDFENTLLRGIYEIIERDAFMTVYLTKARIPKIDLTTIQDKTIQNILEIVKRYQLEIEVFDLTNNLQIPSFLSVLVDRTGLGPSISLGLKSSLNPKTAIIGSMEESFHTRPWMKREVINRQKNKFKFKLKKINTLLERGLLWTSPGMIKSLGFLFNQPKTRHKYNFKKLSSKEELKNILKTLKNHKVPAFYTDITIKDFRKINYLTLKAILPTLQPLFLHESHREIRWKRVEEISYYFGQKKMEINPIPHPFL